MYRYMKLILENWYLLKKNIDFDRNIKKYLLCLVIKTIFWHAFDIFIVCLYNLDLLISKGYWRCVELVCKYKLKKIVIIIA
jgi:hypothetical protein